MVVDQATRLRELVKASRTRAKVVAVTSGKGGVGKSNLALNLAIAAAPAAGRVFIVDADFGLANIDVLCGVTPSAGLADVIAGRRRLHEIAISTPFSVRLVPGANGIAYLADLPDDDRTRLLAQLQTLEREADLIVIDTGAGISRNVIKIAAAADECLVVTTPEPTSITDAYAVVKLASREREHGRISVVVNQADSREQAHRVALRIASVARQFLRVDVEYAGFVFTDSHVPRAVRMRQPFVAAFPASAAAACVRKIASGFWTAQAPASDGGFLERLRRLVRR